MKRILCWLLGHRWTLEPYEDGPNGWSYEHHQCGRCEAHSRQLVASRIG